MVAAYLSLLCSINEKPLEYWGKHQSQTGCIRKILDSDLLDNVIEIQDIQQSNISKTLISCPPNITQLLNVGLPVLVIILKNFDADCRFQIQVIDTDNIRHHFQFYTGDLEKSRNVRDPVICRAKIQLQSGWNKIELNLKTLTDIAFKSQYIATQRLEICANCRLRRIYFVDRHYNDSEISLDLYQGFLDLYMLKWGIYRIENATQTTNLKQRKTNLKNNNNSNNNYKEYQNLLNANNIANSNELYYNNKISNSFVQTQTDDRPKDVNSKLINNIRMKSNSLIDEFFSRQRPTSLSVANFKDQIIIKSYVVPTHINKTQKKDKWNDIKLSNWNKLIDETKDTSNIPISLDMQKEYNETFNNQQQKYILKSNNLDERWTYRYLYEGKHYLKTNDITENDTSDVQSISYKNNSNFIFPISQKINNNVMKITDVQKNVQKKRKD
ncbi:ribosomal protein VAR1, mitochondrial-like [Vespa crabro]|uniref:ribosomal protein VAR1, mitochondrial-like n=1 Tax=Vespa crabro TaxID=7445 RepID=UPI001F02C9CE|nr:ribosomal protein VAR1, mitochondrial-like [Vespa crabro]